MLILETSFAVVHTNYLDLCGFFSELFSFEKTQVSSLGDCLGSSQKRDSISRDGTDCPSPPSPVIFLKLLSGFVGGGLPLGMSGLVGVSARIALQTDTAVNVPLSTSCGFCCRS